MTSRVSWLLLLLVLAPPPAAARPAAARPAWDREVGRRLEHRPTRSERRRFALGETVDGPLSAHKVIDQIKALGARRAEAGIKVSFLTPERSKYPIVRIDVPAARPNAVRALINAGTHNEEVQQSIPQALAFLEHAARDKGYRSRFQTTMLIKLGPDSPRYAALPAEERRLTRGKDMNRTFAAGHWIPESRAIRRSLAGQPFDVFVDLHADSSLDGFVLVNESVGKHAGQWSMLSRALSAMPTVSLVDAPPKSPVYSDYTLHRLGAGRTPTSFVGCLDAYLAQHNVPYSFTLETPQRLSVERQRQGGVRLLRSILENVRAHGLR
jgi:hypothetical protein